MKFYEIPETKCTMHILVYSVARRPHDKKLLSTTLHTPYLVEI